MKRSFTLLTLATAVLLSACSGSDSTGPSPNPNPSPNPSPNPGTVSPIGSYVMTAVDGNALPHLYDQGNVSGGTIRSYWLSGTVTFKADSTFLASLVEKTTGPGQSGAPNTSSIAGYWRLEPGGLELRNGKGDYAHWTSNDGLKTIKGNASYTKVTGGKGVVTFSFVKK